MSGRPELSDLEPGGYGEAIVNAGMPVELAVLLERIWFDVQGIENRVATLEQRFEVVLRTALSVGSTD